MTDETAEVAEIELRAPAKLTLSLKITGVRPDGYHLLDAEMVTVDLADSLFVTSIDGLLGANGREEIDGRQVAAGPGVDPAGHGDPLEVVEAPGGLPMPSGPDNTVCRALALAGRRAAVRLLKRIPAGAGLGGGSADAAAVLRWCGITDLARAAQLGADVPFCVAGGRARVRGIGEVVEPLPFEDRTFTLLIPPFGCSTPAVYAAWGRLAAAGVGEAAADVGEVAGGVGSRWPAGGVDTRSDEGPSSGERSVRGGAAAASIHSPRGAAGIGPNDLEEAALLVEPRLAAWRDRLAAATGKRPVLAGSGSTWFVEGAFPGDGRIVVHTCR